MSGTLCLDSFKVMILDGVHFREINHQIIGIISVYQKICAEHFVVGCITGGCDEPCYVKDGEHDRGMALDLRSKVFTNPRAVRDEMEKRLKAIDESYIVIYLNDYNGFHFHAAWRGKSA